MKKIAILMDLNCTEKIYSKNDCRLKDEPNIPVSDINHSTTLNLDMLHEILKKQDEYNREPTYIEKIQKDGMTEGWRRSVCEWMNQLANEFHFDYHTVASAMEYVDRYLTQHSVTKEDIQLLALVAIFLSSKMHEKSPLLMKEALDLANGEFNSKDIRRQERELLMTLNWKLNPPTAFQFLDHLLLFFMSTPVTCLTDHSQGDTMYKAMKSFCEDCIMKATEDYNFLKFQPLEIACGAILCGMEGIHTLDSNEAKENSYDLFSFCGFVSCMDLCLSAEIWECREKFMELCEQEEEANDETDAEETDEEPLMEDCKVDVNISFEEDLNCNEVVQETMESMGKVDLLDKKRSSPTAVNDCTYSTCCDLAFGCSCIISDELHFSRKRSRGYNVVN